MRARRLCGALVAVAFLFLAGAGAAKAQEGGLVIDGHGGIAVPAGGDWGDLVDPGPTFGASLGYKIHPRVAIQVTGDADLMSGADIAVGQVIETGPDFTLVHFKGGLAVELTNPEDDSPFSATINAGGGITSMSSDDFTVDGTTQDFSESYPSLGGGIRLGYALHDQVEGFVSGQWHEVLMDEEDTLVFRDFTGTTILSFGTASQFPLTVGFSFSF